jgi:hypothetical protein
MYPRHSTEIWRLFPFWFARYSSVENVLAPQDSTQMMRRIGVDPWMGGYRLHIDRCISPGTFSPGTFGPVTGKFKCLDVYLRCLAHCRKMAWHRSMSFGTQGVYSWTSHEHKMRMRKLPVLCAAWFYGSPGEPILSIGIRLRPLAGHVFYPLELLTQNFVHMYHYVRVPHRPHFGPVWFLAWPPGGQNWKHKKCYN